MRRLIPLIMAFIFEAAVFVWFVGCGEQQETPLQPVKVEVPERISVQQPIKVAEPVKVIVVPDPATTLEIDVEITWAGWAYGGQMGLFQFIVQGKIINRSNDDIAIDDIDLLINGRNIPVKTRVLPGLIPAHSDRGWFFYVRSDDTVFYPKAQYWIVLRVSKR